MRRARVVCVIALVACGGDPSVSKDPICPDPLRLELVPELPGGGQEEYVCYAFDPTPLGERAITAISWQPPSGGIALHHATLFAITTDFPAGPVTCGDMLANATPIHVWTPGGQPLRMPEGTGLALPEGTSRLVIETHLLALTPDAAGPAVAEICPAVEPPSHPAAWLGLVAPTPAIRPHFVETSTGSCHPAGELHLLFSWPHMHRIGSAFRGEIVRASGERTTIVELDDWSFDAQRIYPVDLLVRAGDSIETTCTWENPTDEYVLPGISTNDEMCNQGLIAWPRQSARCVP